MAKLNTEIVNLACTLCLSPGKWEDLELAGLQTFPPRNLDRQ